MENSRNFERAQASRARVAAPIQPITYPGSNVKDALRVIAIINLLLSVVGALVLGSATGGMGFAFLLGIEGLITCALLFALAAIVENLIAIRRNTEG